MKSFYQKSAQIVTLCEMVGIVVRFPDPFDTNGQGKGRTLVAIQSGANIGCHRLRHISERAELGEKREAILSVTIP